MPFAPQQASLTDRMRSLANTHKPAVDIHIGADASKGQNYIHAFSTGDKITGHVSVTSLSDTKFDDVEILLLGTTKTYVERVTPASVNGRTEAFQQFLKLSQPMFEDSLPEPRVLKAGHTYSFPFTFVVPRRLLPTSCKHQTARPEFKDAHLQLPPSMGDPTMSGHGSKLLDDLSPAMARIWYSVRARITRNRSSDGKPMPVAEKSRKIRVVPATEDQPPVEIDGTDDEYCMRKEKNIRKGFLNTKTGRLAIETRQPNSLSLAPPNGDPNKPEIPTTVASLVLRFDPSGYTSTPPRLSQLISKLKVATFFSSAPRSNYPSKKKILYDASQGLYVDVLPLASRCMALATWDYHAPGSAPSRIDTRRGSTAGPPISCPEPTVSYDPKLPFFTMQVLVPISVPKNKVLLPTFHSCLVSRIYVLDLSLPNLSTGSVSSGATLKVPLQITSKTAAPLEHESRHGSVNMIAPEDEYFEPRSVAPPTEGRRRSEASALMARTASGLDVDDDTGAELPQPPPEYSHLAPRTGGVLRAETFWHTSPLYSLAH